MKSLILENFLRVFDSDAQATSSPKMQDGWNYCCLGEADGDWSSIENLNGHFLLMGLHEKSREQHVWTNRFGTFHCYYAYDGKRAALGTDFKAVSDAASKKELDWEAIAGFFSFGFFPQDRTYFKDVKILKPASHYVFDEYGKLLKSERYWSWRHNPDPKRSYDETVEEFAGIFHRVIKDQTKEGRIALPISGGLDSRSTVAAVINLARGRAQGIVSDRNRFWAYSYGYSDNSVETQIAGQIAHSTALPFQSFTIKPYLFDRLDLILSSVGGFQDLTQCRQAAITDEIAGHADRVIAAHWGDVWMDGMLSKKFERQSNKWGEQELNEKTLEKILKSGRGWLVKNICEQQLKADPEALLREMVRVELKKFEHIEDRDFRIKAFKTDNWSFRWTCASLRMFQPAAFPRLPFYDNRMADFFCTVPTDFVRERRLQIDYLKHFAPNLAQITWQSYNANLYEYQHFNSWLLPKRTFRKMKRLISGKSVIERNWEIQFLNEKGRQGLDHWLIRKGLKVHEFSNSAKIQELLKQFYQKPSPDQGYAVSMLLTFSAWLEKYG